MSGTAGEMLCVRCSKPSATTWINNGGPYCPWCVSELGGHPKVYDGVRVMPCPECESLRSEVARLRGALERIAAGGTRPCDDEPASAAIARAALEGK